MQNLVYSQVSAEFLNKTLKRTRKKSSYRKINNETRQNLIEMVKNKNLTF